MKKATLILAEREKNMKTIKEELEWHSVALDGNPSKSGLYLIMDSCAYVCLARYHADFNLWKPEDTFVMSRLTAWAEISTGDTLVKVRMLEHENNSKD